MLLSPARWGDRLGRCTAAPGALWYWHWAVPTVPCAFTMILHQTQTPQHLREELSHRQVLSGASQGKSRGGNRVWMDAERSKQARQWVELTVRTKETDECKGEPRGQKRPAPLITLIHQLQQMMEYCSTYTFHQGLKVKVKALTPTLAIRK